MTETLILTWKDRMRIERAVWTLDSYLRNLPRKSRIAKRRELRVNLRAASADVASTKHCGAWATFVQWPPNTWLLSTADRDLPGS